MYVTVCVMEDAKRILPWIMLLCSEEHTFVKLYEDVRSWLAGGDFESGTTPQCSLSRTVDCTQRVAVELYFNVVECCTLNGQYVRYILRSEREKSRSTLPNACSVMMALQELLNELEAHVLLAEREVPLRQPCKMWSAWYHVCTGTLWFAWFWLVLYGQFVQCVFQRLLVSYSMWEVLYVHVCFERSEWQEKQDINPFPAHKKQLKQAETMYYSITPSIKTSI